MPNEKIFDIVMLLALPASGKSEVRRYLRHVSNTERAKVFHMGPNLQLDDFPYVHLMRVIDEELEKLNQPRMFYIASDDVFIDNREWATLIILLNDDYADLIQQRILDVSEAGEYYLERIEKAAIKVGIGERLSKLSDEIYAAIAKNIEHECQVMLDYKIKQNREDVDGKTIIMEFARGGAVDANMPLTDGNGYEFSLTYLDPEILRRANIIYIWVTPEESRRKNSNRADPNNPGSILHHGVPIDVMLKNYGCDDIEWLEKNSDQPGTIKIKAHDKFFHIPLAKFDNREDKTSFLRANSKDWAPEKVKAIHEELKKACDALLSDK